MYPLVQSFSDILTLLTIWHSNTMYWYTASLYRMLAQCIKAIFLKVKEETHTFDPVLLFLLLSRSFPVPGPARIKIGCEEWDPWRRPCRNLLGWSKRGTISAMSLTCKHCKRLQLVLRRSQRTTCQTTVGCSAHSVRDFCKITMLYLGRAADDQKQPGMWYREWGHMIVKWYPILKQCYTVIHIMYYHVFINDPCIYIHLISLLSQQKFKKKNKGAPLQWLGHAWSRMHAWGERHVGILVRHDCKGTSCGKWVQSQPCKVTISVSWQRIRIHVNECKSESNESVYSTL